MARHVTRRDFINGVALATGAGMLGTSPLQALEYTGTSQVASFDLADYPPVRTGLRGSHEGSSRSPMRWPGGARSSITKRWMSTATSRSWVPG